LSRIVCYTDYILNVRFLVLSGENMSKFVAYCRVSTQAQGRTGLGIEAQRAAVESYVVAHGGELVAEFVEVETGKGADALSRRPELKAALNTCSKRGAVLLIAKLDRLARNVHFVSGLLETGCDFVAVDMPNANKVMIQMHAVMSEWERDQISARTKAALAAAKARGVKLGVRGPANLRRNLEARMTEADEFAARLRGLIAAFRSRSLSQRAMVNELNVVGVPAPRGGRWSLAQIQRVLLRLNAQMGG
jgi:DNA invertase Pin-like site-specific DNA recombinase